MTDYRYGDLEDCSNPYNCPNAPYNMQKRPSDFKCDFTGRPCSKGTCYRCNDWMGSKATKTEEEYFCEELQELLDKYKTRISVPAIMRNAQKMFRNTLSIKTHPELHPYAKSELDYLKEFLTEGPQAKIKCMWEDELEDMKRNGEWNERGEN